MRRGSRSPSRSAWRSGVVVALIAGFVAVPFAARLLPGDADDVAATTLLGRVTASSGVGYSGLVETNSGLSLPVDSRAFGSLADLFGEKAQLRVWWRAGADWRVDRIAATGEDDVVRDANGLWTWNYEQQDARRSDDTDAIRLPRADDLLPGTLGRRLLGEARPGEVSRIDGVRVAGERTAGLRLVPADHRSTIKRVDVWALPDTGLPVRVAIYGSSPRPILTTSFLDLDVARPASDTTAFTPPAGSTVQRGPFGDVLSFIDRFGRQAPPARVGGLERRTDLDLGAIGVYGRGVTLVVAIPLTARLAGDVVPQLRQAPGAVEDASGIAAGVGPLNLALSPPAGYGARWLLFGTVSRAALRDAVAGLPPLRDFGFGR